MYLFAQCMINHAPKMAQRKALFDIVMYKSYRVHLQSYLAINVCLFILFLFFCSSKRWHSRPGAVRWGGENEPVHGQRVWVRGLAAWETPRHHGLRARSSGPTCPPGQQQQQQQQQQALYELQAAQAAVAEGGMLVPSSAPNSLNLPPSRQGLRNSNDLNNPPQSSLVAQQLYAQVRNRLPMGDILTEPQSFLFFYLMMS